MVLERKRYIHTGCLLLLLLAAVGCRDNGITLEPDAPSAEAATLIIDVESTTPAWAAPNIGTKSGSGLSWEELDALAQRDEINSLFIMVCKYDNTNLKNSRVIAYRLFLRERHEPTDPPEIQGQRLLFYNKEDVINPNTGVVWPNALLSQVSGIYSGGVDDTQTSIPGGHNGWVEASGDRRLNAYFDNAGSMHGSLERVAPGDYFIYALANFTEGMELCDAPYPDKDYYPTQTQAIVTDDNGQNILLPVLENPACPIGYHVYNIVAYWQKHQADVDFDGVPIYPCVDEDVTGLSWSGTVTDAGGTHSVTDWFMGAGSLLSGRLVLNDLDDIGFRTRSDDHIHLLSNQDTIISNSYIRSAEHVIPQSCFQPIKVVPGENRVSLRPSRMVARTTFHINNQSPNKIVVKDFSLSDNFAQAATYIFPHAVHVDGSTTDYSATWRGQPDVTSSRAIVPFVANDTLLADHEKILFDAYTYEAQDDVTPISFSIRVQMMGGVFEPFIDVTDVTTTNTSYSAFETELASAEWAVGDVRYFLMQNRRSPFTAGGFPRNPFIYGDGSNNPKSEKTLITESNIGTVTPLMLRSLHTHIWGIEKVSTETVRIKNYESGLYFATCTTYDSSNGVKWTFTSNSAEAQVFKIKHVGGSSGEDHNNNIEFYLTIPEDSTDPNRNVFLHTMTDNSHSVTGIAGEVVAMGKWDENASSFRLYPVAIGEIPALSNTREESRPITRVSYITGVPEVMHSYRRNEHTNVIINVRYNPVSQQIEFGVEPWTPKSYDITFN